MGYEIFRTCPVQWVPGVKSGGGVTPIPHPLLVPWSRKGRAIPLLPLWAVRPVQSLSACTRVPFTFTFCDQVALNNPQYLTCFTLICQWMNELYTGCPRRNVPDFGRVFLMLKYTDITQNTYMQS